MQAVNRINGLAERAQLEGRGNVLTIIVEEPLWMRLYKAMRAGVRQTEKRSARHGHSDAESRPEVESEAYTELAFLRQQTVARFPVRLAHELIETSRAIRQDPAAFINLTTKRK